MSAARSAAVSVVLTLASAASSLHLSSRLTSAVGLKGPLTGRLFLISRERHRSLPSPSWSLYPVVCHDAIHVRRKASIQPVVFQQMSKATLAVPVDYLYLDLCPVGCVTSQLCIPAKLLIIKGHHTRQLVRLDLVCVSQHAATPVPEANQLWGPSTQLRCRSV